MNHVEAPISGGKKRWAGGGGDLMGRTALDTAGVLGGAMRPSEEISLCSSFPPVKPDKPTAEPPLPQPRQGVLRGERRRAGVGGGVSEGVKWP